MWAQTEKLEENSPSDFTVKILGSVTFILCTLVGIFSKIKTIKRVVARDQEIGGRQLVIRNAIIGQTGF